MANEQNLKPNEQRTPEERRELARVAGIASGVARRRRRALREAADIYLALPVKDKRRLKKLVGKDIPLDDIDNQMAMVVGLVEAATAGDARAANVIVKLLGEAVPSNSNDDQLEKAAELLGGIDSVIK